MAKKRKARKTTTTRKYRRNPSARRTTRIVRRGLTGLNFKSAFKNVLMLDVGMFAAKFAAKRFGGGASELDPNSWGWRAYLQASAGAAVAGMVMNMVKPGTGQKVLEGGLAYVAFKAIQNELISGNATAESWLGASEMPEDELLLDLDGTPYMNYDGVEYPLDESHRMGDTIVPVGRLGDTIVPVGRLGMGGDMSNLMSAYKNAYRA